MTISGAGVSNFAYTSNGIALHVEAAESNGPGVSVNYNTTPGTAILTELGDPLLTELGEFILTEQ